MFLSGKTSKYPYRSENNAKSLLIHTQRDGHGNLRIQLVSLLRLLIHPQRDGHGNRTLSNDPDLCTSSPQVADTLTRNYWGGFIALHSQPGSGQWCVLRDCSGSLPCYYSSIRGVTLATSDARYQACPPVLPQVILLPIASSTMLLNSSSRPLSGRHVGRSAQGAPDASKGKSSWPSKIWCGAIGR